MKKVATELVRTPEVATLAPGLVLFCGFLLTQETKLLSLAAAFLLWPTYKSLSNG